MLCLFIKLITSGVQTTALSSHESWLMKELQSEVCLPHSERIYETTQSQDNNIQTTKTYVDITI